MRSPIGSSHGSIPRGGLLALLLSTAVPGFAAPARIVQPMHAAAYMDEAAEERAPTWAPATLVGEVLVMSDGLGRLAVAVDEAQDGRTSRGAVTRLFLLTSETPITEPVQVRFRVASVIYRGDSLTVSSPARGFTVDIALRSSSDGRHEIREDGLVLHDGLALQSLRLAGPRVPLEAVPIDDRPPAIAEAPGSVPSSASCQAGGDGATTCTKKCSMGAASVSFVDECSVTCTAGYHACCNCIVPSQGATCKCVKDEFVGPVQPRVKVDLP